MRAYIHMPVEVLGMTRWATSNGGALLNLPNWVGLVDSFQSTAVAAVLLLLLLLLRTRERGSDELREWERPVGEVRNYRFFAFG